MFIFQRPLSAVLAGLLVAWAVPVGTGLLLDHLERAAEVSGTATVAAPAHAGVRMGDADAAKCRDSDAV